MVKSTKYFRVWMIFVLTSAYSAVKSTILADALSVLLFIKCVQTGACTIMVPNLLLSGKYMLSVAILCLCELPFFSKSSPCLGTTSRMRHSN